MPQGGPLARIVQFVAQLPQGPQAIRVARRRLPGSAPLGLLGRVAQPLAGVMAQRVHQEALGLARAVGVLAVGTGVALGRTEFVEVGRPVHRAVVAAGIHECFGQLEGVATLGPPVVAEAA